MLTASDTAFSIAAVRAEEGLRPTHERLFEDRYASLFEAAGVHAEEGTKRYLALPFFRDGIRLRTRFIDDVVGRALADGVDQIVLLGAGFDTRALRIPAIADRGARVYEIDLPEQLRLKHAVAPLLLVGALSSDLVGSRGAVIALGDSGVTRPFENHVAYLTAKGALQTGLRALAVELAPHVRINMVALGIVADPEADGDPLRTHRLAARSPLGRFGTPDEVAHVVLALLDATWATGEIWGIGR